MKPFRSGFKRMIPIMTGVVPFGAVMGTVSADAKLTLSQTVFMNILMFAGAAQLAIVDLMTKHTPAIVVIITGLIINLRFILYSAALAPLLSRSKAIIKLSSSYFLTDQSYALMAANEDRYKTNEDKIRFYFGSVTCMALTWHFSVLAGYLFGNFAPSSWSLDYAVPLSFIALLIPTLKNRVYVLVAVFSFLVSLVLKVLPYNLGLIVSTLLAISLAAFITRKRQ